MEAAQSCWHDTGRRRRAGPQTRGSLGKLVSLYRLLNEHGGEIEADLLRFYRLDLLDFYRGTLSARRLDVLVKHLPHDSATVNAVTDGDPPFSRLENLIADLWSLWASSPSKKVDHPVRAAQQEKARTAAKQAKVIKLRAKFEKQKRAYGLG